MILDALPSLASTTRIVLASASPRRAELLRQLGVAKFDVRPSSFDEDLPKASFAFDGARYAEATARAKAADVATVVQRELDDEKDEKDRDGNTNATRVLVIGADTVVEVEGEILEKPPDGDGGEGGRAMLRRLSGREHKVSTGVALVLVRPPSGNKKKRDSNNNSNSSRTRTTATTVSRSFSETTLVRFADLPEREVAAYVASGEGRGKAGGYGIQGPAAAFVTGISGCYHNVVGMPLHALAREVEALLREEEEEEEEEEGEGEVERE